MAVRFVLLTLGVARVAVRITNIRGGEGGSKNCITNIRGGEGCSKNY